MRSVKEGAEEFFDKAMNSQSVKYDHFKGPQISNDVTVISDETMALIKKMLGIED